MLTVDTNILIYAVDQTGAEAEKGRRARRMLQRMTARPSFLTQQVIGEFMNVCCKRRVPERTTAGLVKAWSGVFPVLRTGLPNTMNALHLACRFRLQYWDALIVSVALSAGGLVLFSEDMQDGRSFDGLRIVNPFEAANESTLNSLLG